ncbi:MAG: hypothetical protein AAFY64_03570, partial [Pseudomonadota bacterium]
MRILIAIPHYCGPPQPGEKQRYASQLARLPRAIALNTMIVALHRHYGPTRMLGPVTDGITDFEHTTQLDIVIITMRDRNALELVSVDPSHFDIEYFTGEPLMLSFETQRVLRDRCGSYDLYGTMEDDL